MHRLTGLCAGLLVGLSLPLAAQTGSITGTVVTADSARPIAGAQVGVMGLPVFTTTDSTGHFTLAPVPAGSQTAFAISDGYERLTAPLVIAAGETKSVTFKLRSAVVEVATIAVIGSPTDQAQARQRLAEVPGGVALVTATEIRQGRQANLKDALRFAPGVYIQPRFGAADESQISVRGSGLRNNFHARGINLLVNGMPYRNADGFTDFESLELMTAGSIEVYKGGNAFRYGGSTLGGAINLTTQTGYSAKAIETTAEGGSYGFLKGQAASGGAYGKFDYYASYAHTALDGFRDWSEQRRDRVNLHAGLLLSPGVDVRGFYFFAKVNEQLPGALTRDQLYHNPEQAVASNVAEHWGRDYHLHHLGVQLRAALSPTQRIEVSPYFQYRDIDHPIFQVINQQSHDIGTEVRYENSGTIGGLRSRLTVGSQLAHLSMADRNFVNNAGQHGDLTKDQQDFAATAAGYVHEQLYVTADLALNAGLRFDHSVRRVEDRFLSNGDQSDRRTYDHLLPSFGALYQLPQGAGQLFANVTKTFEPPLLLELNSLTVPGFVDVAGQSAWQFEVGTRGTRGRAGWELSLYDIELRDEILNLNIQPFPGAGFTVPTYRNANRTRHYGVELGGHLASGVLSTDRNGGDHLELRASYTYARNTFVRDSLFDGNDIPGQPAHLINAELKYRHPSGFSIGPNIEWAPKAYFVNSANTDTNRGWLNLGARANWSFDEIGLDLFLAAQNLTNRIFSPSVQVDSDSKQYYEPVDRRSIYLGARWTR